MFISLLIIIIFSLLLTFYLCRQYTYWLRRGIPQETPYPLVGNFKGTLTKYHLRDVYRRLYRQFKGKAAYGGAYVFFCKIAIIVNLDLVKQLLIKDFSTFHDRGIFGNARDDPLSSNLVTMQGDEWHILRAKLTPILTAAKLKNMYPLLLCVAETLTEIPKTAKGLIVDVNELCARFTVDAIGTCVFGIECNSLQNTNSEFMLKIKSIITNRRHPPLVEQFVLTHPKIARKLRMKMFSDDVIAFFTNIVKETIEHRVKNNIKRNDFMDLLIELKAKDEDMVRASQGLDLQLGLTIEQLASAAFMFFKGGYESSSATMTFCLYELACHPDIQSKLRQEILTNIRQHNGQLTYEGLSSMEYLEQVLSETLRHYTVFVQLIRTANEDFHVPNSHHVIEKNTGIGIPIDAIHHDPEYYEDPETFRPERFEQSECEKRHPCAFLPFGSGPRQCIAMRFAKMVMKVGLASLVRHYQFELCPQTEVVIDKGNYLLTSRQSVNLKVTPMKN